MRRATTCSSAAGAASMTRCSVRARCDPPRLALEGQHAERDLGGQVLVGDRDLAALPEVADQPERRGDDLVVDRRHGQLRRDRLADRRSRPRPRRRRAAPRRRRGRSRRSSPRETRRVSSRLLDATIAPLAGAVAQQVAAAGRPRQVLRVRARDAVDVDPVVERRDHDLEPPVAVEVGDRRRRRDADAVAVGALVAQADVVELPARARRARPGGPSRAPGRRCRRRARAGRRG